MVVLSQSRVCLCHLGTGVFRERRGCQETEELKKHRPERNPSLCCHTEGMTLDLSFTSCYSEINLPD